MSKFDAVLNRISEALPVSTQQPNPSNVAQQQKPATAQQTQVDPKIVQELIAAQNEQQVKLALQKLQATQATQQKPATGTQPAAV